jgi:hypothetical protein
MKNKIAISLMVTFFVSQVMASTSDTITLYSQFLRKESKFVVITPSTYNSNSKNQTNQNIQLLIYFMDIVEIIPIG